VAEQRPDTDWHAIEQTPEFQELTKSKRAFVLPATIFFLAWYFGFILLCGYAPDFMGREFITDGLTVGYFLALTQFLMSWVLAAMYVRRANKVWDPLAASVVKVAERGAPRRDGRFVRDDGQAVEPGATERHEEVQR
jgi:uncharacterized membrane protein (DUF485 family)